MPGKLRRSLLYATAGVTGEVVFTALDRLRRGADTGTTLEGHSYIWMLPVYGSAAWFFEPLHNVIRSKPVWQRAVTYAAGITSAELLFGLAIRRMTGNVPWDYTEHSRLAVKGAIRLDYLPLWAAAGLALERLHDAAAGTARTAEVKRPSGAASHEGKRANAG